MRVFILAVLAVVMTTGSASASVLGSFLRKGPVGSRLLTRSKIGMQSTSLRVPAMSNMTRFEVGDKVVMYLDMESISSSDGFFSGTPLDEVSPPAGGPGYKMLGKGVLDCFEYWSHRGWKSYLQFHRPS